MFFCDSPAYLLKCYELWLRSLLLVCCQNLKRNTGNFQQNTLVFTESTELFIKDQAFSYDFAPLPPHPPRILSPMVFTIGVQKELNDLLSVSLEIEITIKHACIFSLITMPDDFIWWNSHQFFFKFHILLLHSLFSRNFWGGRFLYRSVRIHGAQGPSVRGI